MFCLTSYVWCCHTPQSWASISCFHSENCSVTFWQSSYAARLTFQTTDYLPVPPPPPPSTHPPSHQPTITTTHHAPTSHWPPPPSTTALHPTATTSPRHHTPTTYPNALALVLFPVQFLCNHGKIWKRLNVLCYQSHFAANKISMLFYMVLSYK